MRLVLATGNPGKLKELTALLAPWQVSVLPQSAFTDVAVDETGLSFVENALLKARHAARVSGLPAVADDSGLEVDALDGGPGIRSARYAGPDATDSDNLARLLKDLESVPPELRRARYRCALVFLRHAFDPSPIVCQARWEGSILEHPRGTGGFGYDPVFALVDRDVTAAELPAEEKNRLSHRGKALAALVEALSAEGLLRAPA